MPRRRCRFSPASPSAGSKRAHVPTTPEQPGPKPGSSPDTALTRVTRSLFNIFAKKPLTEEQEDTRYVAQSRRYWDDSVALTLTDLVRQEQSKASGRVQTINLADFRSAIGAELWVQYQERILL